MKRKNLSTHSKIAIVSLGCLAAAIAGLSALAADAPTHSAAAGSTVAVSASPGAAPHLESQNVPEPKQVGGESDGIVQVANLVYATNKSSHCFSDFFLIKAADETAISTSRRFHAVKLSSEELFGFPMVIMTGEGGFELTDEERENFVHYVKRGGFVLASASCSSEDWEPLVPQGTGDHVSRDPALADWDGSPDFSHGLRYP